MIVLLLAVFLLVGCSGGSDAPPALTETPGPTDPIPPPPPPPPPGQASLIYRAGNTLVRSQTDGSQPVTLALDATGTTFPSPVVTLNESTLVYTTRESIKTVRTDGTNPQFVTALKGIDHFFDVVDGWLIYYQHDPTTGIPLLRSLRPDGTQDHAFDPSGSAEYVGHVAGRVIFMLVTTLVGSALPADIPSQSLVVGPSQEEGEPIAFPWFQSGAQMVYALFHNPPDSFTYDLFAVDVRTGVSTTLATDPAHEWPEAVVGPWVVYHRCAVETFPPSTCDVYRVNINGTGTLALSTHPDNDAVQGVVGQSVLIRRSHGGTTDTLVSVPVTGGEETPILTLSFTNDFVRTTITDRIIVQRDRALWSVKADGSDLVELTASADRQTNVDVAGAFVCFNRGTALWCVPADGSAEPTKVTDHGEFVTGL